ncbi:hypothetical protein DICA4_B01508 [Diutina catenulata]
MGPRHSVTRCSSCRRLKIKCDGRSPCEYCAATGRRCLYETPKRKLKFKMVKPSSEDIHALFPSAREIKSYTLESVGSGGGVVPVIEPSFTNLQEQLQLSPVQSRLIAFISSFGRRYYEARDPCLETIWAKFTPELFLESELVKSSVYTYSGVILVRTYNHKLLQDADFANNNPQVMYKYDDRVVTAYQYSLYAFNTQVREISRLVTRLHEGTITVRQTVELLIGSMLIVGTLCNSPSSRMPLVNFDQRTGDFLSARLGVRVTFLLARKLLANHPKLLYIFFHNEQFKPPVVTQWVPVFAQTRRWLTRHQTLSDHERAHLEGTLRRFNNSILECAKWNTDVPLMQAAGILDHDTLAMVYGKHVFALQIIYLYSCFSLLTSLYYNRENNMFVDYMWWYKEHCFSRYRGWFFPWDASIHSLVLVKKYHPASMASLAWFDPVKLDKAQGPVSEDQVARMIQAVHEDTVDSIEGCSSFANP